jgi:hypothetical protein
MKPVAALVIAVWAAVLALLLAATVGDSGRPVRVAHTAPPPPPSTVPAVPSVTGPAATTTTTVALPPRPAPPVTVTPARYVHTTTVTAASTVATVPAALREVHVILPNGSCAGVDAADIPAGSRQVPACPTVDPGPSGEQGVGPDGKPVAVADPPVWVEYPGGGCGQTGSYEAKASGLKVVPACPNGGQ